MQIHIKRTKLIKKKTLYFIVLHQFCTLSNKLFVLKHCSSTQIENNDQNHFEIRLLKKNFRIPYKIVTKLIGMNNTNK